MSLNEDNKRIAKNTIMLYIRMIVSLGVSLYTSRVILNTLGITDYGINNVVSGIISMFTFINGSLSVTTTRFLTFELGCGNEESFRKIFSMSINLHIVLSAIILILSETIGLWILVNKLVIPEGRFIASVWVYQVSILSCILNTINVPYISAIISHEKMGAFGYMTILDSVLKLLIVYLLVIIPLDKLVMYAWLFFGVNFISLSIYRIYCKRQITGTKYCFIWNRNLFTSMFSFTGWSSLVHIANFASSQGLNMLLNVFFGPVVNAARGITDQVNVAIYRLSSNFQTALNPQITKNYAQGNHERVYDLLSASSRFAYYIIFIISLPIAFEAPYILHLWLGEVPSDTVQFLRVVLLINLIEALANPIYAAVEATGNIRKFQIVNGIVLLFTFPISYVLLKYFHLPALTVFLVQLGVAILGQYARQSMALPIINMKISFYWNKVLKPICKISLFSIIVSWGIGWLLNGDMFICFLLIVVICIISSVLSIWIWGLEYKEKYVIVEKIRKILKIS